MTATKTFTDLGLDAVFDDALAAKGITHPFPIQELTLPLALKGADLIGQARTGTGKTLAFGLPLLQRIDPSKKATQALVIVPTRELCLQVADDLEVGKAAGITTIAVYGGVGYDEQIAALTGGVHVVVGTPGRTLDQLQRGNLDLSEVHVVVLDEADEMLDMGFLPDVERLLSGISTDRQTMLFSATMPTAIVKLARRFMDQPTFMRADAELHETAPNVEQYFFLVHRMDKPRVLARILQTKDRGGAFVFTRTKNMADRLVRELDELNVRAIAVHGDLRQVTREKNMDRFRDGRADVLVATEVAARGLDVDNVTHVVNYDCPDDEKMYLHRIGRTARAGAAGVAVTFAEFNEVDRVNVIRKAVGTEQELKEIFSTSDELTRMFDLPGETPWGHLSSTRSTGSGRSTPAPSRSTAASDGRSRNRTPARDRARDAVPDAARRDEPTKTARTPKPRADRPSAAAADTERTRTRTRERTRTAQAVDADGGDATPADAPETAPRPRTRARAGSADAAATSRQAKSSKTAKSSETAKTSKTSGTSRARNRDDAEPRTSSKRTSSKKSTSRSNGAKKSADDRGRRRGDEDATGRHGSTRATAGTRRGEQARGEGTPRFSRRVEVEHLP